MLRDAWAKAGELQLAGRLDFRRRSRRGAKELLAEADPCRPKVVLDHNPREWDKVLDAGADLVLCGHTHGGQTFPGNILLRLLLPFPIYGEHIRGAGRCIVTSGVGVMGLPVRLGVRSEIVVIRLLPEKGPSRPS